MVQDCSGINLGSIPSVLLSAAYVAPLLVQVLSTSPAIFSGHFGTVNILGSSLKQILPSQIHTAYLRTHVGNHTLSHTSRLHWISETLIQVCDFVTLLFCMSGKHVSPNDDEFYTLGCSPVPLYHNCNRQYASLWLNPGKQFCKLMFSNREPWHSSAKLICMFFQLGLFDE